MAWLAGASAAIEMIRSELPLRLRTSYLQPTNVEWPLNSLLHTLLQHNELNEQAHFLHGCRGSNL